MVPSGSLLLTGGMCCTKCQITHAKRSRKHEMTRCAEHMSFTYARGLRPALYKGLHATAARLVQKVVAGTGSGNCALRVKLTKMFNVPGVAHWNAIFSIQAGCTGPGDSYYPIRAFPLWRQLVGILGRLNAPKNKVAFLKAPGMNLAAMVAAQGLLVACCSHSHPKMIFLEERCVILPQFLLLKLVIGEPSR